MSRYEHGFVQIYQNEVNTIIITQQEQVQVLFATYRFTYKVGNIPTGGTHSVQLPKQFFAKL